MAHNWALILTFLNLLLTAACSTADLLDEYVKHVENVNRISRDYEHVANIRHRNVKPYQRNKRSASDQIFTGRAEESHPDPEDETSERDSISPAGGEANFILAPNAGHRRLVRRSSQATGGDMSQWTHSQVLDDQGDVLLRWQPRHKEILFRVEARTRGYVGIGFSPNGGMAGADIVLGWVDDRSLKTHLLDCHGVPSQGSAPVRDEIDNYTVLRGAQNDTHTVIEFKRVLDTCDLDDYVLTGDTVRIIWALHDSDPKYEEELVYHGERRGTQSVHLMGPPPPPKSIEPHVRQWDVTVKNFEVKHTMNTIYWCKIFKAPALNERNHIIGYEPLIGKNHTSFVHHMILHECYLEGQADMRKWNQYASENGHMCYGSDMPHEWVRCLTPLVAWAVGSKGENFPKHVGLPLDYQKSPFYMLQIHFDNPSMKRSRDSSGVRLYYTPKLRENEGGVFATGVALSTLHFIPPYQPEYKTAGYCSFDCTKHALPRDGINVVSVMLHSHLAGRRMKLRHMRAGKELQPLAEDNHYDFNYQQSRNLPPNAIILPGDGLITECTYSTINRKKPTLGGYASTDEMCLAFVLHYPRTELAGCSSMPPIKYFFENLGVKEFYGHNMSDVENLILQEENEIHLAAPTPSGPLFPNNPGDAESPEANRKAIQALMNAREYIIEGEISSGVFDKLIIKEPLEFQNKTFSSHLQAIPYNETLITKKMEEYFYTGLHLTFCIKRDDTSIVKETVEKFPNFTVYTEEQQIQCSYKHKRSSSSATHKPNIILMTGVVIGVWLRLA